MNLGLIVTGTDTEIGKTFVTCALARLMRRRGVDVGVMKPVACGAMERDGQRVSEDALLLREAAGVDDPLDLVNPLLFGPPLAPVPAARLDGVSPDLSAMDRAFETLRRRHELLLVEGVGGILVPVARGVAVGDLAARWSLPVLIVARPRLGTVNHTLLTIEAARNRGARIVGVVFTASDAEPQGDAERTGPQEIAEESGVANLGEIPHLDLGAPPDFDRIADACAPRLSLDTILDAAGR